MWLAHRTSGITCNDTLFVVLGEHFIALCDQLRDPRGFFDGEKLCGFSIAFVGKFYFNDIASLDSRLRRGDQSPGCAGAICQQIWKINVNPTFSALAQGFRRAVQRQKNPRRNFEVNIGNPSGRLRSTNMAVSA